MIREETIKKRGRGKEGSREREIINITEHSYDDGTYCAPKGKQKTARGASDKREKGVIIKKGRIQHSTSSNVPPARGGKMLAKQAQNKGYA